MGARRETRERGDPASSRRANSLIAVPLDRETVADSILAAKGQIFDALGVRRSAWGAFPYLVGKLVELVAARVRAGGPAEVLLSYPDLAVLANGRTRFREVTEGSLRVPFNDAKGTYAIARTDPALAVEIGTPEVRGTANARGLAGIVVKVGYDGTSATLGGATSGEPAFAAILARELEKAREVARNRATSVEILRRLPKPLVGMGQDRFAAELVVLAKRHGFRLAPIVALALVLSTLVGGTVVAALAARKIYQLLVTTPASRYAPIPANERPRGPAQTRVPVTGPDWSGVVETRPRGAEGVLLTFVPEKLPEHRAPDGHLLAVDFAWAISEAGGEPRWFQTMSPQLFYRYLLPRAGPVDLTFTLTLRDVDLVDVAMPGPGRVTYEAQRDGSPPKIRVRVKDADGTVDQAVVTPVPAAPATTAPSAAPTPNAASK